jgi:lantibiotic modifying enzyme
MEVSPLDLAARIGWALCREAEWHRGRCNWIARSPDSGQSPAEIAYRPLPANIYFGSGGVALLLSSLAVATSDRRVAKTAEGAMRHALESSGREPALGLFAGRGGVALAGAIVGEQLENAEIAAASSRIATRFAREAQNVEGEDLISGAAGVILALLHMPSDDSSGPLARAQDLGHRLVARRTRESSGCSWRSASPRGERSLLGMAHGASGIALALLELHAQTNVSDFRTAAIDAMLYESSWLDERRGGWPDLRGVGRSITPGSFDLPVVQTWCYGAPGIGLVRLRAYEHLGEERWAREAELALNATHAAVEIDIASEVVSASGCLCHGAVGNALVLLEAFDAAVATPGLTAVDATAGWLCAADWSHLRRRGLFFADPPGLMNGLAGVAQFCLASVGAGVPRLLLPARRGDNSIALREFTVPKPSDGLAARS